MTALTKLQLALLKSARGRPDGQLLPAPKALSVAPNRVRKAVGQLIELGLAAECDVEDQFASLRADGERLIGAVIVEAGWRHIIQADPEQAVPPPARQPKNILLVELLSRARGVSVEELVAATNWQAHTARAAITILKTRKSYAIERFGERGASRYRIASAG